MERDGSSGADGGDGPDDGGHSDDGQGGGFLPKVLDKTVIALPLFKEFHDHEADPSYVHPVLIDLNLDYYRGLKAAERRAKALIDGLIDTARGPGSARESINVAKSDLSPQHLFAHLRAETIRELVRLDDNREGDEDYGTSPIAHRSIYHIWPDFKVRPLITKSISTVKADAARQSFSALGAGIVWAVLDSGIAKHRHFEKNGNLKLEGGLKHFDFTGDEAPLTDPFGHGTHVAGIIAGEAETTGDEPPMLAVTRHRDEHEEVTYDRVPVTKISGMAPQCKLMSMRVLNDNGDGETSSLIAAIQRIQEINGYGRRIVIHGVNLSVGYSFEPEWFACGQSPLCVEVDRLVRSGVVVVVAAGNTGWGWEQTQYRGAVAAGLPLTINDPGNADLAITVGSTHREMPFVYGVSYFSSKGPTGDGRLKPDLVAPGEKILSCAAGRQREAAQKDGVECDYVEDSGTSMAAPHVAGVIAAFLSIRREFIGRPDRIRDIFLSTATDLRREVTFQGKGLVDLMRAIQSV